MPKSNGIDIGASSHVGRVRDENQDYQEVFETAYGYLLLLADGMGGHQGGALAAKTTVQELRRTFTHAKPTLDEKQLIQHAFENANAVVYQQANAGDPATHGMGSTAVVLLQKDDEAWIAHVGDSRAYLVHLGRLIPLTKDHSRVQRMVDAGILTADEARVHPDGNILDQVIGHTPKISVDVDKRKLHAGDSVLLCSDGLWAYATEYEIEQVLKRSGSAQRICDQLLDLALAKGGEDNITVQLLRYEGGAASQDAPTAKHQTSGGRQSHGNGWLILKRMFLLLGGLGVLGAAAAWIYHLNARIEKETDTVVALRQNLSELEELNSDLTTDKRESRRQNENTIAELQEEVSTLKVQKGQLERIITRINQDNKEANKSNYSLRLERNQAKDQYTQALADVSKLEKNVEEWRNKWKTEDQQRKDCEQKLATLGEAATQTKK